VVTGDRGLGSERTEPQQPLALVEDKERDRQRLGVERQLGDGDRGRRAGRRPAGAQVEMRRIAVAGDHQSRLTTCDRHGPVVEPHRHQRLQPRRWQVELDRPAIAGRSSSHASLHRSQPDAGVDDTLVAQHVDRPVHRPAGGEAAQIESTAGSQLGRASLVVQAKAVAARGLACCLEGGRWRQRVLPEPLERTAQGAVGTLRPEAEGECSPQHCQGLPVDRYRTLAGSGVETDGEAGGVDLAGCQLGDRGAQSRFGGRGVELAHLHLNRFAERLAAGPPTCRLGWQEDDGQQCSEHRQPS
jgi:hypothetical protein